MFITYLNCNFILPLFLSKTILTNIYAELHGFLIFKNTNLTALTCIKTKFKFLLLSIELVNLELLNSIDIINQTNKQTKLKRSHNKYLTRLQQKH